MLNAECGVNEENQILKKLFFFRNDNKSSYTIVEKQM